jgi:hypothetical protein
VPRNTDSAAPYFPERFYRVQTLASAPVLTGDHLVTADGEVIIHPVNHASFVMHWNGKTIYNDPVGGAAPYASFPRADLILVSHVHGDHYDNTNITLAAVLTPAGDQRAAGRLQLMTAALKGATTIMLTPDESCDNTPPQSVIGLKSRRCPPTTPTTRSAAANPGYVYHWRQAHFGNGDTGSTAEMRALPNTTWLLSA